MNGPSISQRQALGNLADVLTSKKPVVFKNYFKDFFEEWNPIYDSNISGYSYYKAIKDFPLNVKRYIVQAVLKGWNLHKDLLTLYETINTLIYLDVCGPAEYYFMQIAYNMLSDFSDKLDCQPFVEIQSYTNSKYTMRFWKDVKRYDTYGIIDFELHNEHQPPLLAVVPWFDLLKNVYEYDEEEEFDEETIDEVTQEIYPLFENEFAKKHCHRIQSEWDFGMQEEQFGRGILYIFHSLKYVNHNG